MKKIAFVILAGLILSACMSENEPKGQWSVEKANEWYSQQEWPVGCNYVPSYAINQYEFWQEETFNPEILDKELAMAEDLGFNALRIYLHEGLWYADKDGFKSRINKFFDLAESHGIKLIVTFFTNGGNHEKEFALGPQPEAIPGMHNSNWIPSPGRKVIDDPTQWPRLKEYVQDILKTYKDDSRVLYWCLCNEPENMKAGCDVKDFMPAVYQWAWEIRPSQPLSSPVWQRPGRNGAQTKLDLMAWTCMNSDIITFHCYSPADQVKIAVQMFQRFGRPIVCQEYLARNYGNTFETVMPILKENKVGAINWGLINNKCNFHLPWGHKYGDPEPEVWFHDILRNDGTPYSEAECEFIRSMTADKNIN